MANWKLFSWKTLSLILTIILIPFIVNLVSNFTAWIITKDKVEITLKLDGWITVGSLVENSLPNLKLIYENKLVKNALKITWRVINTGSKGIERFEKLPSLIYPKKYEITEAIISQTSPSLKIEKDLLKNPQSRSIEVRNMGIFNKGDFYTIDVYVMDISDISIDYFKNWDLIAKSLDLSIKKEIAVEAPREQKTSPLKNVIPKALVGYSIFVAFIIIFRLVRYAKR